jgi:hypothetical protein
MVPKYVAKTKAKSMRGKSVSKDSVQRRKSARQINRMLHNNAPGLTQFLLSAKKKIEAEDAAFKKQTLGERQQRQQRNLEKLLHEKRLQQEREEVPKRAWPVHKHDHGPMSMEAKLAEQEQVANELADAAVGGSVTNYAAVASGSNSSGSAVVRIQARFQPAVTPATSPLSRPTSVVTTASPAPTTSTSTSDAWLESLDADLVGATSNTNKIPLIANRAEVDRLRVDNRTAWWLGARSRHGS